MIDCRSAGLTEKDPKKIYKWMDLGRKTDERLWLLNRAGEIPLVVGGQGRGATQIGMAYAMQEGDISSPYYRDLALITYMGISPLDTVLPVFGRRDDTNSGGKQIPSHFGHKGEGILSQSSPVATQIPHSASAASALKIDNKPNITTTTVGEGSSNQGDFHGGMNFAAVHKLPFICVVISNRCVISVPDSLQYAAEKLSDRALGYGMRGIQVDGDDPIAVYKTIKEARERALAGEGPTLTETVTSRMTPHSSDDGGTYRTKEEGDLLKQEDCNIRFKTTLLDQGIINEDWLGRLETEHKELVNEATRSAEAAPYPSEEETLTCVCEEGGQQND